MSRRAVRQPIHRSSRRPSIASTLLAGALAAALVGPTPFAAAASGDDPVTIAVSPDHAPWSYTVEGGAPRGILIDLWREWADATGSAVTFVVLPDVGGVDAVRSGEVDVLGGTVATDPAIGLIATDELLHVPIEAYMRVGTGITSLESLGDASVGMVAGHGAVAAAMEHHNEVAIVPFTDSTSLYAAAAAGSLDAFVDEGQSARHGLARVGALGEFDRVTPPVAVVGLRAFTASAAMRYRVQAGMNLVDGDTRQAIIDRWTLSVPRRVDPGLATLWLLGILLVAGLTGHSLTVRRQVKHRTAALEASRNELAAMNERLRAQATHDLLTGLANRRLFIERIGQAVSAARRTGDRVAVLYLDLDDFKAINDRLGHGAGDEALITIADRIRGCVRQADTAARLGGDEFAVLVDRVDAVEDAKIIAAKVAAECGRPVVVGHGLHRIGASIGIAMFPEDGHDADALLAVGDRRMYLAKMRSKGLEFLPRTPAPPPTKAAISD